MEGDIFTSSKTTSEIIKNNNFFVQPENIAFTPVNKDSSRHLNDYDSNLLREDAYKDVNDEIFKLEYKISKAEDDIKSLEAQIEAAKGIGDVYLVESLEQKKSQMQSDLNGLIEIYNDTSISAKISGGIAEKIKTKFDFLKQIAGKYGDSIISKLPGKFSYFSELKSSLRKLENINKSVDELMAIQNPYGEYGDKYEQLSKYITCANNIQAEISKYMK